MSDISAAVADPVRVGVIGAGRIGTSHATLLAREVPGAHLVAVADARAEAAERLAGSLGCRAVSGPAALLADDEVEAVVIAASSTAHAELVVAAARAGKAVFCEKPMAMTLEDADRGDRRHAQPPAWRSRSGSTGGSPRTFAAAAPRSSPAGTSARRSCMRSLTRDPGLRGPGGGPAVDDLLPDPDPRLRHAAAGSTPGREAGRPCTPPPTRSSRPTSRTAGLLDTAVVVITFDNGAIAIAEANFSAVYGYDVRGEVFGSAGMVTMGDARASSIVHLDAVGAATSQTVRGDVQLFRDAYIGEFAELRRRGP